MAWVRLLKAWETNAGKKLPIGKVTNVSRADYKNLMATKSAEDYDGTKPPKRKLKTDFFKPKTGE